MLDGWEPISKDKSGTFHNRMHTFSGAFAWASSFSLHFLCVSFAFFFAIAFCIFLMCLLLKSEIIKGSLDEKLPIYEQDPKSKRLDSFEIRFV